MFVLHVGSYLFPDLRTKSPPVLLCYGLSRLTDSDWHKKFVITASRNNMQWS